MSNNELKTNVNLKTGNIMNIFKSLFNDDGEIGDNIAPQSTSSITPQNPQLINQPASLPIQPVFQQPTLINTSKPTSILSIISKSITYFLLLSIITFIILFIIDYLSIKLKKPTRFLISIIKYLIQKFKNSSSFINPILNNILIQLQVIEINTGSSGAKNDTNDEIDNVKYNDEDENGEKYDDNTYNEVDNANNNLDELNELTKKPLKGIIKLSKSSQQVNDVEGDSVESSIQTTNKAGWCYVGNDRGYRSCMEIGKDDTCLSGDIFANEKKCVNINLSNNTVFYP
jgi:hypothetical protein